MNQNSINNHEWQLITQALLDAEGYPKSEENKKRLGYSSHEIRRLLDELLQDHNRELSKEDEQIIVNSIDGALEYVTIDIPSLYNVSEVELRQFKRELEERWKIRSTYKME